MKDEIYYKLKQFNGENVEVYVTHKIYGTHKIKCIFNLLKDEEKIGLITNGHEIYVAMDELESISYSTSMFEIIGKLQTIKVILQ